MLFCWGQRNGAEGHLLPPSYQRASSRGAMSSPKARPAILDSAKKSTNKLTWAAAAAAGLLLTGCPESSPKEGPDSKAGKDPGAAKAGEAKGDKECCMGLNECKGKGGCAVPESNACAGKNECKGKGGCNMHCPK